jgi:hypothetical protein
LLYDRREEVTKEAPRAETPQEAPAAEVIADVALGILVEDTLKGARDMSIDSLLEVFNYGL